MLESECSEVGVLSGMEDVVGGVKREANIQFRRFAFSSEVVAVELLCFNSAGTLFFCGERL